MNGANGKDREEDGMRAKSAVMVLAMLLLGWIGTQDEAAAARIGGHKVYIGAAADTSGLGNDAGDYLTDKTTGKTWIYDGTAWVLENISYTSPVSVLSAPGYSAAIGVNGFTDASFAIQDSLYGSTSVTLEFQGKKGSLDWGPLDADSDSLVVAKSGTTYRSYAAVGGLDSLRWRAVSEAGGTGAIWRGLITLWRRFK